MEQSVQRVNEEKWKGDILSIQWIKVWDKLNHTIHVQMMFPTCPNSYTIDQSYTGEMSEFQFRTKNAIIPRSMSDNSTSTWSIHSSPKQSYRSPEWIRDETVRWKVDCKFLAKRTEWKGRFECDHWVWERHGLWICDGNRQWNGNHGQSREESRSGRDLDNFDKSEVMKWKMSCKVISGVVIGLEWLWNIQWSSWRSKQGDKWGQEGIKQTPFVLWPVVVGSGRVGGMICLEMIWG